MKEMKTAKLKKPLSIPAQLDYCSGVMAFLFLTLSFTGCVNGKSLVSAGNSTSTKTLATTSSSITANDSFKISNVIVGTVSGSPAPLTSIYFDTARSTGLISNHCSIASGSKPCVCSFVWQEINQVTGSSVQISRSVQTSVSLVQASLVSCNAPDVFLTEIPNGTPVKIIVLPTGSNTEQFSMTAFSLTKTQNVDVGTFRDAQGNSFHDILHYGCYQQYQRGMSIFSKTAVTPTNPTTGEAKNYAIASQFCVQTASGQGSGTCPTRPPENSAQAYYYNLYIRDSESGDINYSNVNFVCPQVTESLGNNGSIGTQGKAWPLDSNFALALAPTADFKVGVESNTKLSKPGDPVGAASTCYANASGGSSSSSSSLVQSCLGFAAKPAGDGSCPYFTDTSGIRLTYRLRRYVAIYPNIYNTDGKPLDSQGADTIYVLDRPINAAAANPLKPFTMRGPKPCPFSYFDNKGVTPVGAAGGNAYRATNDSNWTGVNVDGIEFPNTDSGGSNGSPMSCSAVVPVLSADKQVMSIATVNKATTHGFQHVYVRPIQAWTPHYEEDTSFQACAPQPQVPREAPIHFAKDTTAGSPTQNNVAWCSESYPTQNGNVTSLDAPTAPALPASPANQYTGKVIPFTSHIVKNTASAACTFSSLTLNSSYPAAGQANHPADPNTCDRTVTTPGLAWPRFPLLAPAADVESAISSDSSYQCMVTYDNGGSKTGVKTPSSGCCAAGNVGVSTGAAGPATAHLEPDRPCIVPTY